MRCDYVRTVIGGLARCQREAGHPESQKHTSGTLTEIAHLLCQAIEKRMAKLGVITTAHYETGIPLIVETLQAERLKAVEACEDYLLAMAERRPALMDPHTMRHAAENMRAYALGDPRNPDVCLTDAEQDLIWPVTVPSPGWQIAGWIVNESPDHAAIAVKINEAIRAVVAEKRDSGRHVSSVAILPEEES